eukprot:139154-Chlamydomonas_euryale.AAC.1
MEGECSGWRGRAVNEGGSAVRGGERQCAVDEMPLGLTDSADVFPLALPPAQKRTGDFNWKQIIVCKDAEPNGSCVAAV